MSDNTKVVGLYGDVNSMANDPGSLDAMQGEFGLNRIIVGAAWNLSPKVRAINPWGVESVNVGPGMQLTDDDSVLRRAIDEAHKRGIKVWACNMLYWCMANPPMMAWHLNGKRMDEFALHRYAHEQGAPCFCPNNPRLSDWYEAAFVDVVSKYDLDGMALTHARYSHPAFFEVLFGCGCPTCAEAAARKGYDFPRMKAAMLGLEAALQHAPAAKLRRAVDLNLGFAELLTLLGVDGGGIVDWFNFRALSISDNLKRFHKAIDGAVKREFAFGSDTFYPTFALLAGQRYPEMAAACDQILPLLTHLGIHSLDNLVTYAELLVQWCEGLSERDALRLVYQLFGYDKFELPDSIAGFGLEEPYKLKIKATSIPQIVASEMAKARLYAGDRVLSYPVISGDWPRDTLQRLMAVAEEAGHNGIVFQGAPKLR